MRDDERGAATARGDAGVRQVRERFGGIDLPATLVGMLTGLALVALLGGLIGAAVGVIGYQTGVENVEDDLSVASLIGGAVTLFLAFLVGGWAAARIARYDGPRNGLMTGVWTIVLAAVVSILAAALGAKYDILSRVDLPQWFSQDALTGGAIVSALVAVVAMLAGGFLGGAWGERYHRRADAELVATRPGGIRRQHTRTEAR
ncbi:MAG: hypothetical protein H0V45_14275 [Actinobacteria bacterium]|nr:hypothetical protein [Actinomycetota bacterium]